MARFAVLICYFLVPISIALGQNQTQNPPQSNGNLLSASQSFAPAPASVASQDPQATAVIQQFLAHDGLPQDGIPIDSIAQGTIAFSDSTSAKITIRTKGTDRLKHDIDFGTAQLSYVLGGGQGYRLNNGTKENLPLHTTFYQRVEYIPALSRVAEYASPSVNLAYVGLENLATGAAHHIKITNVAADPRSSQAEVLNSEFHLFIDPTKNVVVKTVTFPFSPEAIESRFLDETYFSDYRTVNGVAVSFHTSRFVRGQRYSDCQLSSVQIGSGLTSDPDFQ